MKSPNLSAAQKRFLYRLYLHTYLRALGEVPLLPLPEGGDSMAELYIKARAAHDAQLGLEPLLPAELVDVLSAVAPPPRVLRGPVLLQLFATAGCSVPAIVASIEAMLEQGAAPEAEA